MPERTALTVAAVQMTSGPDKKANIARATALTREAARTHASLIVLPETFDYRGDTADLGTIAESLPGSALLPLMDVARETGVWVLAGSVHEASPAGGRPFNTSVLISPNGGVAAHYRKIHLFDIVLGDRSVTESAKYQAGTDIVCTDVDGVRVGLSICYDLRFPELYRALADAGADLVCIPSSFTAPTGEAHWEILIRARAIENQCFVVAPGQAGVGAGGIRTYGNSMIVDPWGRILARASAEREEIVSAVLDLREMEEVRQRLPALHNRKPTAIR
jgi:deaminated glutathione amidase